MGLNTVGNTESFSSPELPPQGTQANTSLNALSIALAVLCAAIWAGQSVAVKVALQDVPPLFLMSSRFVLSLPVIYVMGRVWGVRFRASWSEQKVLAISALLLCAQISLFTLGTHRTSSVHSIILINMFPFFTVLCAWIWLPDATINWRILIGLGVAFAGVIIVVADQLRTAYSPTGDLLVVGAAAVMGVKIVFMKHALTSVAPVKLVLWDNLGATLLLVACGLVAESWSQITVSLPSAIAIVYQGILVSAVAFLIWVHLLAKHSPNELNVFRMATPPLGAVFGVWILAEPISAYVFASLACVCLGIYFVLA